jgi:hypothetical protein
MTINPQSIEDKQKEYRRLEAPSLRAAEYLKSEKYHEDNVAILERIYSLVANNDVNDHAALRIFGRVQQIIEDWKKPQNEILQFDSVKQSLNRLLANK